MVTWLPKVSSTLTRFWGKISTQYVSEKLGDAARRFSITLIEWHEIVENTLNLDSSVLIRYENYQGAKRAKLLERKEVIWGSETYIISDRE